MSACCVPPARGGAADGPRAHDQSADATTASAGVEHESGLSRLRDIPAGAYLLGDHFDEGYVADGERPVHAVSLPAFSLGATAVTNVEFAAFSAATGHVTTAEVEGSSAVFHLHVRAPRWAIVGEAELTPWWVGVSGADWRHPAGPWSDLEGLDDHPVVHVSHDDALAYCRWAGRRLPAEAEWEAAARGGLVGARFPWGDQLEPGGQHVCNVFHGDFPYSETAADGWSATAPVRTYPANGYGLHEMSGNVWEWCADWFDPAAYQRREQKAHQPDHGVEQGSVRVMRGGSFLCHHSYCHRYRVSARSASPPDASASNLGFRCAGTPTSSS